MDKTRHRSQQTRPLSRIVIILYTKSIRAQDGRNAQASSQAQRSRVCNARLHFPLPTAHGALSVPTEDVRILLTRNPLDVRRQLPVHGITVDVLKVLQLPRLARRGFVLAPLSLFVLEGENQQDVVNVKS
jgi:hypothetical protein